MKLYNTKEDLQKRVEEHYNHIENHYQLELFGVFLEGSQNYVNDLFFKDSDVDTIAVVIPSKEDLLLGRIMDNKQLSVGNGEFSKTYDVRTYLKMLKKSGINSQQSLYTEYYKVNEKYSHYYEKIVELREGISLNDKKRVLLNLMGLCTESLKVYKNKKEKSRENLLKLTANVFRMKATLDSLLAGNSFGSALKAFDEKELYAIRKGNKYPEEKYPEETLLTMVEEVNVYLKEESSKFSNPKSNSSAHEKLDQVFVHLLMATLQ